MPRTLLALLIFSSYNYVTPAEIYQKEQTNFKVRYFQNLLNFYRGFDKIIHVDDNSYDYARNFINIRHDTYPQLMVYNHDSNYKLGRPTGGDILNVFFFEKPEKISKYLTGYENISGRDVLLVITHNKEFVEKLSPDLWIKHRHGAGNMLFLNFKNDSLQLFHICQYCGMQENLIMPVQETNRSKVDLNPSLIWPNTFRHFYGNNFTVLFNQYFPFMHCLDYMPTIHQNKTFNKCLRWVGSEGMMLDTLSKTMNFTYGLIALTEYITVDKIIPYIDRNEKIDFAIGGIGLSATRIKKLQFSRMINYENMVLMYKIHTGWKDRLFAFSNAFPALIWVYVGLTSITVSLALYTSVRWLNRGRKTISVSDILLIPPRMMIEQPVLAACLIKNIKTPILIVLMCWMIGCLEFNTIYKSNLASRIIHPPVEKYRNVHDIVERGYNVGMEKEKTPYLSLILNVKNPKIENIIKKKFFNVSVLCAGVEQVLEEKVALAGEKSFLKYHCQTRMKNYAYEVNYTPEPLSVVTHGWLFRKGAPFVESFNENILRMQASGLMSKWLRDVLWQKKRFFNSDDNSERRVNLSEFSSHFTLYAIGITVSMLAFIYEQIKFRITGRRTSNFHFDK